jgi:hypothetical protein
MQHVHVGPIPFSSDSPTVPGTFENTASDAKLGKSDSWLQVNQLVS